MFIIDPMNRTKETIAWPFKITSIFLVLIIVIAFYISMTSTWATELGNNAELYNSAGIACQVVTALVCCIASMIGISFSLMDSTYFGITMKDFRNLRSSENYSLSAIIIISIVLVALNLGSYITHLIIASFGVSIASITFCIYVVSSEIPLMAKSEKAGVRVLKHRLMNEDPKDLQATDYTDTLKYLILRKNLKTAYELLAFTESGEDERNRALLLKLLDVQVDMAFQLSTVENRGERERIIDRLYENIRDIFSFSFDITEMLGSEYKQYSHHISRVIYALSKNPDGEQNAARAINNIVALLDYGHIDSDKQDFLITIALSLLTGSINKGEFVFARALKKHYSEDIYSFEQNSLSARLFCLISLYYYYLCELEGETPEVLRELVKEFVYKEEIIDNTKLYSWDYLFRSFAEHASIDYHGYMHSFCQNEHSMDYYVYNTGAKWVVLDERVAFKWYVLVLLSKDSDYVRDYNEVFGIQLDQPTKYYLKSLYEDSYIDGNDFTIPDSMNQMLAFYKMDADPFSLFRIVEKNQHTLFDYLTDIKTKAIWEEFQEFERHPMEERLKTYMNRIQGAFSEEWGFDREIELDSDVEYLYLKVEKTLAINYDDFMVDYFTRRILSNLRRSLNFKTIIRDDTFDKTVESLISEQGFRYIALGTQERMRYFLVESDVKEHFDELILNMSVFQSKILPHDSMVKDGAFSFRCEVVDLVELELSIEQQNETIEQYKRSDGQYVFESTFVSRETMEEIVKQKYCILSLAIKYAVHSEKKGIVKFEFFPTIASGNEPKNNQYA